MRLTLVCTSIAIFLTIAVRAVAQDQSSPTSLLEARSSFFSSVSYSPTSSHIFIGNAYSRQITQLAVGYEHLLKQNRYVRASYEGSIEPLFLESDPTVGGSYTSYPNQPTTYTYFTPTRVLGLESRVLQTIVYGNTLVYTYSLQGPRQSTYAFAALPVGGRLTGLPGKRIRPTFAVNLGALYAARNIPVDYTSSFNFLIYAGPGIELSIARGRAIRFEYLYDHLSNADTGTTNPGIDSGTFRVTISKERR